MNIRAYSFTPLLTVECDKNGFVGHPLLSHIEANLYVGMSPYYYKTYAPAHIKAHHDFLTIFNFFSFPGYEYQLCHDKQMMVTHKMYDSHDEVDDEIILKYGLEINKALREGEPVLVHCQMGVNRANLFAASALCQQGMKVEDAIKFLREKRSREVLNNHFFIRKLITLFK